MVNASIPPGGHVQDPPQGSRVHVRHSQVLHHELFHAKPGRQSHGGGAAGGPLPQVVPQEEGQGSAGI